MKSLPLIVLCSLVSVSSFAEQTLSEKAKQELQEVKEDSSRIGRDIKNDTKEAGRNTERLAKKGAHRTAEVVCMKGDKKCEEQKRKHREMERQEFLEDQEKSVEDRSSH